MRALSVLEISRSLRTVVHPIYSVVLLGFAVLLLCAAGPIQAQSENELLASPIPTRIVSGVDNSELTLIRGSTHPAVRSAIDNGRLEPSEALTDLILVLKRSDAQQAALESFNAQQYDPSSPEYHHWLSPTEFGATYGVAENDLDAVTNWLQSEGFTIDEIPPSRTMIRFSGNVAQVENAFHTEMHSITSGGVAHIANMSDISIPTALAPVVVGVKALHNFFPKPQHHPVSRLKANSSGQLTLPSESENALKVNETGSLSAAGAEPNSQANPRPEYSADGYQLLVPYDMATIYNYVSLWTGASPVTGVGQTIALAGTSNIVLSDVATFRSVTGLPAKVPRVIVTNSDPGTTNLLDDRMENTLDVEWSGAAAPGASIVLVTSSQTSQTTDALYASESYIINNNVAKVMSVSYGECELGMGTAGNQEYANLWQQAYTQGIAVFVSSGDSMAAVCDDGYYNPSADYAAEFGTTVSGMTSTPYNVSVGGTDFAQTPSAWGANNSSTNLSNATGYIPELPWNDTVTNPVVISSLNSEQGVQYNAEQWANWLLTNEGINSGIYDELIPPIGGSGGVSSCTTSDGSTPASCSGGYPKPSWQTGVSGIVSSDNRTVPDVSFFASNGFLGVIYLICDTQPPGYTSTIACTYPANALDMAVGGTSVSSPVMAGVMALINQKAGSAQGNPNSVLYGLAAKQTYSGCSAESTTNSSKCYFNDIDTGTIAAPCFGGTTNCTPATNGDALGILSGYAATTGYDKATGLGSLNVANVVNGWPAATNTNGPEATLSPASLTFASTAVASSAATQAVTLTNSGTATMTVSGISITGTGDSSFSETNTCGSTLAVNASCIVTVAFKPAASGSLSATVSFADNAANSPQTVALSGSGLAANTPVATLSAANLTFASTAVAASAATQAVTLTNAGTGSMTISGISMSGANIASFSQINTCGATLAVKASCIVTVTFKPSLEGPLSAEVLFADNAGTSGQSVTLSGTGAAAPNVTVSVSPSSVTFASTAVNATSASQNVTFKNTGTATLVFTSSPTFSGSTTNFKGATSCAGTLAAGSSCTVAVSFSPTTAGSFAATVSFYDNGPASPQTVSLSGTGTGTPAVTLSPTSLTFASTNVGSSSAAQTVTLKNTGTGPLTLSAMTFTGSSSSAFTQTSTCEGTVAASASCTVSVTFKPTASGAASASLSIADNASATAQTVALSGTAVSSLPAATLSASSLSFPVTAVNSATVSAYSPAQAITLTNSGKAALSLTSIALGGTNPTSFTEINNCPSSLAVSASCTVLTRFAPTALGARSATLIFTNNASPTTQSVALTGTGVSPTTLALSATSLSFASQASGSSSAAQAVTLTNSSTTTPVNLTSIALSGTGAASFLEVNNCGTALAANSSCIVLVQFTPTGAGAASATLTVTTNNPGAIATVALSGAGH
jgi:subtilase family serine protease